MSKRVTKVFDKKINGLMTRQKNFLHYERLLPEKNILISFSPSDAYHRVSIKISQSIESGRCN